MAGSDRHSISFLTGKENLVSSYPAREELNQMMSARVNIYGSLFPSLE